MIDKKTSNLKEDILEIDLKQVISLIKRNRKLIFSIIGGAVFFMGIKVFFDKDEWQGSFDILLTTPNNRSRSAAINSLNMNQLTGLNNISFLGRGNVELNTQVEILKSPSVLMPIFNYVKEEKMKNNKDLNLNSWQFRSWLKRNLKVTLQEGTTVLKLKYSDTDKNLIIPVLEKISNEYKKYSNKTKKSELSNSLNYLSEQIKIYEDKRRDSLIKAEKFSIENNIVMLNSNDQQISNLGQSDNNNVQNSSRGSVQIEVLRAAAANEIKRIEELKKQLLLIDEDSDEFIFVIQKLKEFDPSLANQLSNLDSQIARLETVFLPGDEDIIFLKKQQKNLRSLSKKNVINYLDASKKNQLSIQESFKRPTSILIKYKELLLEAERNEITLTNLKNQQTILNLSNQEVSDPWKLITSPTLLPKPIGPSRKLSIIYAILASSTLGVLISYLKEKKSGIIHSEKHLSNLLKVPILCNLSIKNTTLIKSTIALIAKNIESTKEKNQLEIILLGENKKQIIDLILNKFSNLLSKYEIKIYNNLIESSSSSIIIILTTISKLNEKEALILKNNLRLRNLNTFGVFLLNENEE